MKVLGYLDDDQYSKSEITHVRFTARAIAVKDDRFAFLSIKGEDDFGIRDHIESLGGGIEEGEDAQETIVRECMEEAGFEVEVKTLLGVIVDRYYFIQRQTISYFFLVEVKNIQPQTLRTPMEQALMHEILWLNETEALKMLEMPVEKIGRLIQRRDKVALLEALRVLKG